MKTKIIIAGIIASCAFAFSSFQSFATEQGYLSIANSQLKVHKTIPSRTVASCTQCHDCQKDALVVEDTSAVNNQNRTLNFNTTTIEIPKASFQKNSSKKLNGNDTESPNNFKSN